MVLTHFGPSRPRIGSLVICRTVVAYNGFGDLAVFGGFGVKNHLHKKVSERVWGYMGGVLAMFPDVFDAFWAL